MNCSCCGFEIKGPIHKTGNEQKIVCDVCWNNPDLFFAEKIAEDQRLKLLSKMAQEKENYNGVLELTVIKLYQKNIDMYVGKMRITDILDLYELDKFKEEHLEGYQRERYEERTVQLIEYIEKSPLAVMPALLVGLRDTNFEVIKDDIGTLRLNRKRGAIWIIDGQHRIGGFSKIKEQFIFAGKLSATSFTGLMDYELPIVFIDSTRASEKISTIIEKNVGELLPQDIEKTIFFIVNKTQRGISPSLKDALQYSIKTSGIEGLSLVDREGWRILGAEVAIRLNADDTSPFKNKINVSGQRNSGKPIQLNSFVSSLEILFKDKEFSKLTIEEKIRFLQAYWTAIKRIIPEAFKETPIVSDTGEEFGKRFALNINDKNGRAIKKQNSEKYLVLTALCIFTLNRIARDLLHACLQKGEELYKTESYIEILAPLKEIDWKAQADSQLSALGGMKGVGKAYDLLSEKLGQEKFKDPPIKKRTN
ncbi:MAG: DGQHR domain-containing protein [Nitrososphaerota archaeon]|nr:DGQHR domain-containing protein [Nitrososphaerota archaeon]